jgi:hypothetical protein
MERRKGSTNRTSSPLPVDFLKMVAEVFTTNFDEGLKSLRRHTQGELSFEATGAVYLDEAVLCVSILERDNLAATTVYASLDYDPKASAPTLQDLLGSGVDAIGALYNTLLDPTDDARLEQIASHSVSALEHVPFEWAEHKAERYKVYLKLDKSNPRLEGLADDWLRKNDPDLQQLEAETEEEVENLFITGPGTPKSSKKIH